jgi:hypothetical protein
MSSQELSGRVARWDAVDAGLATFAHMAVAAVAGVLAATRSSTSQGQVSSKKLET